MIAEKANPSVAGRAEGAEPECGPECDRGLLAIAVFKLTKALLFFCIGLGAVHYLHKDLGDAALRLAGAFRFDPESRFAALLVSKADALDSHRLKEIGFATFAYSAVALTEGVGLLLEQVWAEYLTLLLTISFLPWEVYELIRHTTPVRLALLATNLVVLGYLVMLVRRRKQARRAAALRG